ncbi:hypothetical protein [Entomospira culicis]|uniref:Uncharacterized protein n=1 Tax=Entomospira culicis TaxID=2719989 RepID=A0A968KV09_9SPIO|nr:hypothetical protein [Entomospira culicis]NIZ19415.1 hypothetical protein [Entomospira culicis]NIZ69680.1 hypothetical protein [Entomospira culicis]WDI36790.1 hypothetical protein PVA46_05550 [Entomospira culicis]WDI38419.1 hypothetical protein PVA47_05560 [Entomospira culicis]
MQLSPTTFPYVIGYHGETAIIDKKLRRLCHNKDFAKLVAEGYLKVAFCQALFQGEEALQQVTDLYNATSHAHYDIDAMKRLLGVFEITQAKKISYI